MTVNTLIEYLMKQRAEGRGRCQVVVEGADHEMRRASFTVDVHSDDLETVVIVVR
jgi:galactose-1-phosphate uridylyltransferase